jgi:hypothetical protein
MQRIFIKKCFLFTVGSDCRVKLFTTGGKRFADDEKVETEVRKWLRQQFKRLLCCGFLRTGKAMGQVYQCWWTICRDIKGFYRFEYDMFYVPYSSVTYLLTLPRTMWQNRHLKRSYFKAIYCPISSDILRSPGFENDNKAFIYEAHHISVGHFSSCHITSSAWGRTTWVPAANILGRKSKNPVIPSLETTANMRKIKSTYFILNCLSYFMENA